MAVDSQLRRLLSKQLDGHDESPLIRSFDELCIYGNKNLFTDFEVDVVIRIVMFWTFRAILLLGDVTETKQISPEGYLDLLKAAWLLQELRDSPRITPAFVETRAVVALVSTVGLYPTLFIVITLTVRRSSYSPLAQSSKLMICRTVMFSIAMAIFGYFLSILQNKKPALFQRKALSEPFLSKIVWTRHQLSPPVHENAGPVQQATTQTRIGG
jgi:uncharacterized membrane protein